MKYTNPSYFLINILIRSSSWIFRKSKLNTNKPAQFAARIFINLTPKPNFVIINQKKLFLHKKNDSVSNCLYAFGVWEPYETKVIKSLVRKNQNIVILGAHIGYYSILISDLAGENGRVYSFEPDPKSFSLLKKNIDENNIKNIIAVNKAVSNKNKRIKLYHSKINKADHQIFNDNTGRNFTNTSSITLDKYFRKINTPIDLVVMDIQGAEINALLGMSKILKNKNLILILEYWTEGIKNSGYKPEKLFSILEKNRFKVYEINEVNKKILPIITKELLNDTSFLNPNKVANLICVRNKKALRPILSS